MRRLMRPSLMILLIMSIAMTAVIADDDMDSLFGDEDNTEEALFGADDDMDSMFGDEDDLFGGDELVSDVEETELDLTELLLVNEDGVVIGGDFSMSITPTYMYMMNTDTDSWNLGSSGLSSTLFFDARPDSDIRIFGKADISYPFTESDIEITDEDGDDIADTATQAVSFDDIISITELFADFNVDETVFIRAGKQALNWGVGYFYSPANLLNVTQIDPNDPEAELEGPLSVKMNMPIGIDNIYGYVILPDGATEIEDLAYAVKYEKVIGFSEVGLGAYYSYDEPPKAMATLSTNIFNKITFFAEGVASYGSTNPILLMTGLDAFDYYEFDDELYLSGTLGGMYTWSDDESDLGLTLLGQYYYNGEGYDGASPVVSGTSGYHYGGAMASLSLTDSLSAGVSWFGDLSNATGMVSPSLSWSVSDYISTSLGTTYIYGDMEVLSTSVSFSLGGTSF